MLNKLISSKLLLGLIVAVLSIIALLLYKISSPPKTPLDCVNLGSNERTELCLRLLSNQKVLVDFPIENLTVENAKAGLDGSCIKVLGTLVNNYGLPATNMLLRINFSKAQNDTPFHYEVFSPFPTEQEQIQPQSRKSFSKCLGLETSTIMSEYKNWYFSILPSSAKISEN